MNAHRRCPGGERRSVPVVMSVGREDQPALRREPRHGPPERSATALVSQPVCSNCQNRDAQAQTSINLAQLRRRLTQNGGILPKLTCHGPNPCLSETLYFEGRVRNRKSRRASRSCGLADSSKRAVRNEGDLAAHRRARKRKERVGISLGQPRPGHFRPGPDFPLVNSRTTAHVLIATGKIFEGTLKL